jgi:methylated-DNA-[protein]-cysteine S-methyltransferase
MNFYNSIPTPLGEMIALADDEALCGLWFAGQKYLPEFPKECQSAPVLPLFVELTSQLNDYFNGTQHYFNLPIHLEGTPFRLKVWKLLRDIPSGATTTYGALAKQLAAEQDGNIPSAQAVGGAVGHNPLSIIIPCHRVIGADGSLTGYAGGLERKAALLALERK